MHLGTRLLSLFSAGWLGAILLASTSVCAAQTGTYTTSRQLSDALQRPPNLDQEYGLAPRIAAVSPHDSAVANGKRQDLIRRASVQLVTLAAVLRNAVSTLKPGTSLKPEVVVADSIQVLAKDLRTAVVPGWEEGRVPHATKEELSGADLHDAQVVRTQLTAVTDQLVALTVDLRTEVSKSDLNTLPVGVFSKSLKVEQLAKSLKERLKKSTA